MNGTIKSITLSENRCIETLAGFGRENPKKCAGKKNIKIP